MKRAFDILVASMGLIAMTPILAVAALSIRLDTPGPAIFRQRRVGLNGKEFMLLKLRSMVVDAPSLGQHSTAAGDPRITRTGSFVRRTSIDELPQLINVLKGEMSIVGPRPDVPVQELDYSPADWKRRMSVKPGITGLAQINGRSTATHEGRLARDLEYVETRTLIGDLRICLKTLQQLHSGGSN